MKKLIVTLVSAITILTACSSPEAERPKTPDELKAELLSQEKVTPLSYLSIEAKMRNDVVKTRNEGLFHNAEYKPDGSTIYGTIKNSATLAKFKDVVLKVTFFSQTNTAIETKDYIIYEFYSANSTNSFELKIRPPEAMTTFDIEVKNATAVD